jgi:lysozyme
MRIFETLRRGDDSAEVRLLQRSLPPWAWADQLNAGEIDGKFGARTEAAVKFYQDEMGLTADGVAGRATCSMLGLWADVLLGVDVSSYQGDIDWPAVEGIDFAIIKATEGKTHQQDTYEAYYRGARARGLLVGAYHFARGGNTPHEEAENFISTLLGPLDLPPALDVEVPFELEGPEGLSWVLAWLEEVERRLGVQPMLYTSGRIVREKLDGGAGLEKYRIWYPRWGDQMKNVLPWAEWDIWQFSNQGDIPGIPARVDLNRLVISSFPKAR